VAKHLRLIDFATHVRLVASSGVRAISNVRFGYEDENEGDESVAPDSDWDEDSF
jgi:hypothetical protein